MSVEFTIKFFSPVFMDLWYKCIVFLLWSVNVINYIIQISNVKPYMNSWHKANLIIMSFLFIAWFVLLTTYLILPYLCL